MTFRSLKIKQQFTFYEINGVFVKLSDTTAMNEKGRIIHVNPNEEIKLYRLRS